MHHIPHASTLQLWAQIIDAGVVIIVKTLSVQTWRRAMLKIGDASSMQREMQRQAAKHKSYQRLSAGQRSCQGRWG